MNFISLQHLVFYIAITVTPLVAFSVFAFPMETIAPVSEQFSRNSQATAVELEPGGRILLAWARYGGTGTDHATNGIYQAYSDDGGRTWSEPFRLPTGQPRQNLGAASYQQLDGRLLFGFWYRNGGNSSVMKVIESTDGGQTWGEPRQILPADGSSAAWLTALNDSILTLNSGRLVWPLQTLTGVPNPPNELGVIVARSDDGGQSWQTSPAMERISPEGGARGYPYLPVLDQDQSTFHVPLKLHEPSVIQRKDGSLWMLVRSTRGRFFESVSEDDGVTWTKIQPSSIESQTAPPYLKRLSDGRMILIWNPVPEELKNRPWLPTSKRPTLALAVSQDEGKTWSEPMVLAHDGGEHGFCYPNALELTKTRELLVFATRSPEIIYPGDLVMIRVPLEALLRGSP